MRCPFCKQDRDRVVDTRPSENGHVIRRRRECLDCRRRYTTHERLEQLPLRVIKKNGRRVPFDRERIFAGVMRALEKRPVSMQQAEDLVDGVEVKVLDRPEREVSTSEIGELVMSSLRALDAVAYVRFASVYREFKEAGDFVQEVKSISTRGTKHAKGKGSKKA